MILQGILVMSGPWLTVSAWRAVYGGFAIMYALQVRRLSSAKRVQHPASSDVSCCERTEMPMMLLGILLKGKPWPCVTALLALYGSYSIFHALSGEEPHSGSPCIP